MTDQLPLPSTQPGRAAADDARDAERAEYLDRLREKLKDSDFRAIEGFPTGDDEAILALSDPPYYTACPNPFLPEIIEQWQREREAMRHASNVNRQTSNVKRQSSNVNRQSSSVNRQASIVNRHPSSGSDASRMTDDASRMTGEVYHREPFASDVSEGKNDPIYNAHSYHTKVPHKAVMRYILHYTDPSDIVFDGFCGTGMTGVAAQLCGDRKAVEGLGYRVDDDGAIYAPPQSPPTLGGKAGEGYRGGEGVISRLGARKAVLVDLSPAATFIAYNYNTPVDVTAFEREAGRVLREVEEECGWMYETWHPHCDDPLRMKGRINYTVWSDVFVCPQCGEEMVFWDVAVDREAGQVRREWPCPGCGALLAKSPRKQSGALKVERAWKTIYDRALEQVVRRTKQVPVLINYNVGRKRHEKAPDADDLALVQKIEGSDIPHWFPMDRMPEGDESRRNDDIGITHVHHFYTRRNLWALAAFAEWCRRDMRQVLFVLSSIHLHINKMRRFQPAKPGGTPNLPGTLYVGALPVELSLFDAFPRKERGIVRSFQRNFSEDSVTIETVSANDVGTLPSESVDYIFVDPPFGQNLMYSELNFLWETWLCVFTNNVPEAVVNKVQRKTLPDYQRLMEQCFCEFYRILKPGRWMTVEFHNSQNRVWNAIQEAILRARFMIADVRTLDKKQGTFKQATSTAAVKQDLVISAYKPRTSFERRFQAQAGTSEGAWDFIRQHLAQLPVVVQSPSPAGGGGVRGGGRALEVVAERQAYLLFDRMVAFHIQRGATVPLSAAQFYAGLRERFVERDGMYFLPDQVPEYDRARLQAAEVAQLTLFVSDEKSGIQWLRQQLDPVTSGHPQTYQELQPQFLRQLHQARHEALPELSEMLEQNFLQDEAGRWYVPDPGKASDLEKLRRKALLREFAGYVEGRGRLRKFRTEAIRAGFADAWHRRDYSTIVKVAGRLPERVLQEDPDLLMYYDNATLRVE